jgi:hypothetical protein
MHDTLSINNIRGVISTFGKVMLKTRQANVLYTSYYKKNVLAMLNNFILRQYNDLI